MGEHTLYFAVKSEEKEKLDEGTLDSQSLIINTNLKEKTDKREKDRIDSDNTVNKICEFANLEDNK